jgi:hypothetical protein
LAGEKGWLLENKEEYISNTKKLSFGPEGQMLK